MLDLKIKALDVGYLIRHPINKETGRAEFNRALALESLFTKRGHRFTIIAGYSEDAGRSLVAQSRPLVGLLTIIRHFHTAVRRYAKGTSALDVLILSIGGPLTAAAGWRVIRKTKIPVVLHIADIPSLLELEKAGHSFKAHLKWGWFRGIEKLIYKRADHIVVVSPRFKKKIVELGIGESKITTLSNAVDRRRFESKPPQVRETKELTSSRTAFRAIYAGDMSDSQGLDLVLTVAGELRDARIEFLMVGEGTCRARLEERAQNEGLHNVTFTGMIPFEQSARLVAACDIALIPLLDGLESSIPSKFYVSLVCQTPVLGIGATQGAFADLLAMTESGVMLPRDSRRIAEALRALAQFPLVLNDIREKQTRWVNAFDSNTVYLHFAKIVEALAAGRRVAPIDGFERVRSAYSGETPAKSRRAAASQEPSSLSAFLSRLSRSSPPL